jgi:hypothetical protein
LQQSSHDEKDASCVEEANCNGKINQGDKDKNLSRESNDLTSHFPIKHDCNLNHLSMKRGKLPWWDMEQSDPYKRSVVQVDEEDCPLPSRPAIAYIKDNSTPTRPGNTTWNHDSLVHLFDHVAIR